MSIRPSRRKNLTDASGMQQGGTCNRLSIRVGRAAGHVSDLVGLWRSCHLYELLSSDGYPLIKWKYHVNLSTVLLAIVAVSSILSIIHLHYFYTCSEPPKKAMPNWIDTIYGFVLKNQNNVCYDRPQSQIPWYIV